MLSEILQKRIQNQPRPQLQTTWHHLSSSISHRLTSGPFELLAKRKPVRPAPATASCSSILKRNWEMEWGSPKWRLGFWIHVWGQAKGEKIDNLGRFAFADNFGSLTAHHQRLIRATSHETPNHVDSVNFHRGKLAILLVNSRFSRTSSVLLWRILIKSVRKHNCAGQIPACGALRVVEEFGMPYSIYANLVHFQEKSIRIFRYFQAASINSVMYRFGDGAKSRNDEIAKNQSLEKKTKSREFIISKMQKITP